MKKNWASLLVGMCVVGDSLAHCAKAVRQGEHLCKPEFEGGITDIGGDRNTVTTD